MTWLFDDADSNGGESTYLSRPQLTFGSLFRHLPHFTHSIALYIIMDLYRKLLTRAVASLSPNEATRIGLSADGDVVRLIAALPCASGAETRYLGISSYDYVRYLTPRIERSKNE